MTKRKDKKPHYSAYGTEVVQPVEISFYCRGCDKSQSAKVQRGPVTGGCFGNHGPGEYCYCPSRHWEVTLDCPGCGATIDVEVDA